MFQAYWKRSAALVTGFARRYRTDPFFRTEAHIISLEIFFSLAVTVCIGAALAVLYQTTLSTIVARIQEEIARAPQSAQGAHFIAIPSFADIQTDQFFLIAAGGILLAVAFGYFIIRVALAPAKNALAAQKQFIGNVAHELRTPLSVIKTNTEVRLLDASLPSEAKELHMSTLEELDRISEIINNLLSLDTLVRPGALEFSDVDLGSVVDDAVRDLAELAKRRRVTVSVKRSDVRHVFGNRTALIQIAVNILKNAIAYSDVGGHVTVTISPDHHGAIVLSIEDTGAGIAEKDLFRIFEPFYRGSASRTRGQGGSGLGLAIVSELVHLHRGKAVVRSTLQHGTTVSISLPASVFSEDSGAPEEKQVHSGSEIAVDFSGHS